VENDTGYKVQVNTSQSRQETAGEKEIIMKECAGQHPVHLIRTLGLHLPILTHTGREDVSLAAYVKDVPKAYRLVSYAITSGSRRRREALSGSNYSTVAGGPTYGSYLPGS